MTIGEIVILAVVQGLTEFLPVSSSGHLVAARVLLGISDGSGTAFDAFLHLGTLLAVLLYYWKVWAGMTRSIFKDDEEGKDKRELAAKIAIATIPGAIAGYVLQGKADELFRSTTSVAIGLCITAAVLFLSDIFSRRTTSIARAGYNDAAYIGLAQVIALVPGISRSGVTMAAGRWRGLSRKQAANFSFLLSAPIIAGAGLSSLGQLVGSSVFAPEQLLIGFLVSFVSGYIAIKILITMVEKISFTPFVIYLLVLAAALLTV